MKYIIKLLPILLFAGSTAVYGGGKADLRTRYLTKVHQANVLLWELNAALRSKKSEVRSLSLTDQMSVLGDMRKSSLTDPVLAELSDGTYESARVNSDLKELAKMKSVYNRVRKSFERVRVGDIVEIDGIRVLKTDQSKGGESETEFAFPDHGTIAPVNYETLESLEIKILRLKEQYHIQKYILKTVGLAYLIETEPTAVKRLHAIMGKINKLSERIRSSNFGTVIETSGLADEFVLQMASVMKVSFVKNAMEAKVFAKQNKNELVGFRSVETIRQLDHIMSFLIGIDSKSDESIVRVIRTAIEQTRPFILDQYQRLKQGDLTNGPVLQYVE